MTLNFPPTLPLAAVFSATYRMMDDPDQWPGPSSAIWDRTCTSYSLPAVRPVIVALVAVLLVVSGNSVQVLVVHSRYRTS